MIGFSPNKERNIITHQIKSNKYSIYEITFLLYIIMVIHILDKVAHIQNYFFSTKVQFSILLFLLSNHFSLLLVYVPVKLSIQVYALFCRAWTCVKNENTPFVRTVQSKRLINCQGLHQLIMSSAHVQCLHYLFLPDEFRYYFLNS